MFQFNPIIGRDSAKDGQEHHQHQLDNLFDSLPQLRSFQPTIKVPVQPGFSQGGIEQHQHQLAWAFYCLDEPFGLVMCL